MKKLLFTLLSVGALNAAPAEFDLSKGIEPNGYFVTDVNEGNLLVAITDAQPRLNGYDLHVSVGNPLYAKFVKPRVFVLWGENGYKEFNLQGNFERGAWTNFTVHIAPATVEDLSDIMIAMETTTLVLFDK